MDLERKSIAIKGIDETGEITAVISTFGRDRDGDVMTREAFAASDGKSIPMVWHHNWDQPIGKGVVSVGREAVTFRGKFLDTQAGQEARKTVLAMDDLQEYSIGFRIKDAVFGYEEEDGARVYTRTIKDLELFEASPVLVGAAYGTHTVAIKSPQGQADLHEQLKALKEQHDAGCELGDACPLAEKTAPKQPAPEPPVSDDRKEQLRRLEKTLGFRPLIAGAVSLD